jgi:hypothetical protein
MQIALPQGRSVTCVFRAQSRDGFLVLSGEPVGGDAGGRCDLVVEDGRITGDVDTDSGRYRILPIGSSSTHAVVEVLTGALPNELPSKRRS